MSTDRNTKAAEWMSTDTGIFPHNMPCYSLKMLHLNTFSRSLNRTCTWLEASPQRNKGRLLPQSTHMHVRLIGDSEVDYGHKACVVNAVSGPNTDTQLSVWGFPLGEHSELQ